MEYKFRGKSKRTNQWVVGSYHYCNQKGIMRSRKWGTVMDIIEQEVQFDSHWILVHQTPESPGWGLRETFVPHEVYPESVGMWTGLKDKNGVDIYEGDILLETQHIGGNWIDRKFEKYVVVYNSAIAGFEFKPTDGVEYKQYTVRPFGGEGLEITGNIHNVNPAGGQSGDNNMQHLDPGTKAEEVKEEVPAAPGTEGDATPAGEATPGTEGE